MVWLYEKTTIARMLAMMNAMAVAASGGDIRTLAPPAVEDLPFRFRERIVLWNLRLWPLGWFVGMFVGAYLVLQTLETLVG